ncbi:MAG: MBL fold metallo-hydrolase [Anaerolineales bacterium]|nr:MAG: MBL fold metallo-hydrolase [Anaerolineales bacterium]
MKITFHGAAQTVTGSRHLLEINGHQLLLDCGLYQGRRKEFYKRNLEFPFDVAGINSVILSHAHIDHSGNLPNLTRQGYEGPIHATNATVHLTDIMTRDSGHIQESDAEFVNRKRAKRGEAPIEPLYTIEDAIRAAQQLTRQKYETPFEPVPGVRARLVEAGHILGSAAVVLELEEHGRHVRLMFSGDIGRPAMPIVRDPVLPSDVDYLILESTYGDSEHDSPVRAYDSLQDVITRTVDRGGKIICPAFAVGRTQTLVYYIHQMMDHGEIPQIPVFVDSPLAVNVTDIFREHPECFDAEATAFLHDDPHGAALGFDRLTYTRSVEESKAINAIDGPVLIISASGMAETGRILHHLRNNIQDERNTVLITSWMAPYTLGRRLAEGEKNIRIFGEPYEVKSEVAAINGLSAHADQPFLIEYATASKATLKGIFLVHGEPRAAMALQEKLEDAGMDTIHYPKRGEAVEL